LKSIHGIYMYVNKIKDLSPLANLNSLRNLYIGDNNIEDLTPLENLKQVMLRIRTGIHSLAGILLVIICLQK